MPPAARPVQNRFDVPRALRRRRRMRVWVITAFSTFALVVLLDHLGAFGWHGDDWRHYDRQSFAIASVIDGQTVILRDAKGRETPATLAGVAAPRGSEYWAAESAKYLAGRTAGQSVIVRLEPTQSRDGAGNLWAYLYLSDSDDLNADVIHDGHAYADRRAKLSLAPVMIGAEYDARKHHRGLWAGVKDEQQPAWRKEWLKGLHK